MNPRKWQGHSNGSFTRTSWWETGYLWGGACLSIVPGNTNAGAGARAHRFNLNTSYPSCGRGGKIEISEPVHYRFSEGFILNGCPMGAHDLNDFSVEYKIIPTVLQGIVSICLPHLPHLTAMFPVYPGLVGLVLRLRRSRLCRRGGSSRRSGGCCCGWWRHRTGGHCRGSPCPRHRPDPPEWNQSSQWKPVHPMHSWNGLLAHYNFRDSRQQRLAL